MAYISTFTRELKTILCVGSSALHVAVLYTVVIGTALFVLPPECVHGILPSLFWICGVLVMQISIRELFEEDYNSGVLEQLLIQDLLPEVIIFTKMLAYWVCVGVPISVISMLIDFVVLGESVRYVLSLGFSLSTGLLVVSFISAVGHTLVLGGEKGLVIAQVLIFPVIVSVVVYFNLLLQVLQEGSTSTSFQALLLLGLGMICLIPISIFFIISAVKLAVEQN